MGGQMAREAVVRTGDVVEGRYRIIKTLGAGGMGTVFLAEHALIKRRVAIKILHPDLATDADIVERFMNEARAAGTLGHPNIVESTDMGFTQAQVPYIVFEYLEGTLLTDEIYRVGGLPVRRAVWIAMQIASALEAAHRAGIVHRDLKSDNIFLTDKDDALDHVKVLDFGVSSFLDAEERQRDQVVGTPEYMSPEQITAPQLVDKRADIYSLGVILYEMLTARRPFSVDDDPRLLMHRIVNKAPPPLQRSEVPHGLTTLVLEKLMAKDRSARYQTMGDVQSALEQFITRGDGTPIARRRSAPIAVQVPFDDTPQTSARLPKSVPSRDTPYPHPPTIDMPLATGQVTLPPPMAAKRTYALYGVAGAGILMGMIGLIVGMRGGNEAAPAPAPAPVVQTVHAPAAATHQMPAAPRKIEVSLDANVANARVVFRRRVQEVPAKMEINATDVVELVEISAPGHKTARYWLTFDRPTYLKAHLVRGNGSYEATEEETLAALGEVIMVSGTAPVAAAPQPAAAVVAKVERTNDKTIERANDKTNDKAVDKTIDRANEKTPPTPAAVAIAPSGASPSPSPSTSTSTVAGEASPVAMAPRKIGRAAAEAEPAVEVTPAAEPAKPDVEPTKEEPKPEAEKVVEVKKAEPQVEDTRPTIDRATMSAVIGKHRPEVLKCFAEGKKKNSAMKGTLTLQLQVSTSGAVARVQVQSTLNNPLVAACVVKAANGWKFPARAGVESATVAYPFTIN
jgi:serine/threonine-protein kinase